jgi:hypothetical protein
MSLHPKPGGPVLAAVCCISLLGPFVGCVKTSDLNIANHSTSNALFTLGLRLVYVHERSHRIRDLASMGEVFQILRDDNTGEIDMFKADYWGRPFRFCRAVEEARVRIRILSDGRNGIPENGQGDDLYVEILLETGKASLELRKLSATGEATLERRDEHGHLLK